MIFEKKFEKDKKKIFGNCNFKIRISVRKFEILMNIASPEIIGVKVRHRQTDRQNIDTVYGWVCVFFSSQNFLPPYLLRSQGDEIKK